MKNNLIYIAGPIMNGHQETDVRKIWLNIENGKRIYMLLVEKGYAPILPHFSYNPWLSWPNVIPWDTWMKMDENYIKASDLFFYMDPDMYGPSRGALREFELAKQLKKTIYNEIDMVPQWKN